MSSSSFTYDGVKLEPDVISLLLGDDPHDEIQVIQRGAYNNDHEGIDSLIDNQLALTTKYNLPPLNPLSESALPKNAISAGVNNNAIALSRKPEPSKKKKEASGPKARPAFVMKIWSMVNDSSNHDYIRWNEDGKTFQVFHREEFMKSILPKYFKHNNFASFVRQLNMYGWHKVQDISSGTMGGNLESDEIWQFENANFLRDREDLLDKIVRNKSVNAESFGGGGVTVGEENNVQIMLNELDQIKMNQLAITEDLRRIRKDNKTLWSENFQTREKNQHQAKTLDKILKFLAAVYGNPGKILEVDNGEMSGWTPPAQTPQYTQPQQPQYGDGPQYPPNYRRRLMLTDGQQQDQHIMRHGSSNSLQQNFNFNQSSPYDYGSQSNQTSQSHQPHQQSQQNQPHQSNQPIQPRQPHQSNQPNQSHQSSQPNSNQPNQHNHTNSGNSNSVNPDTGSIEEIIRSYENTPNNPTPNYDFPQPSPNNDAKRIYQQYINQETTAASPRHFFPELNIPNSPGYFPNQAIQPQGTPPPNPDFSGLEQNVYKQGQSIQQVQDWIQKLALQQQLQQTVIDEIHEDRPELEGFDMSEFLDNKSQVLEEEGDNKRRRI